MPCPSSPEPDGYHRYQVPSQGTDLRTGYTTHCLHCGQEKHVGVSTAPSQWATAIRRGVAKSHAAKRAKREGQGE